jgi:hypothetical protein
MFFGILGVLLLATILVGAESYCSTNKQVGIAEDSGPTLEEKQPLQSAGVQKSSQPEPEAEEAPVDIREETI